MTDLQGNAGPSARIRAIANQKGGVGKTTTTINLGAALALVGRKTLLIDLDPQGNASTGLGVTQDMRPVSTYDVMTGDSDLDSVIQTTDHDNLLIAPSSVDLSSADIEIVADANRTRRLGSAIENSRLATEAEFILIDCPPSLNLLTVNALAASHSVLIPLQCEFFALEGLSQLLTTIQQVRNGLNPALTLEGILLTMYDHRNNLARQVEADVRENLGDAVFDTRIPRNVRLSEAPSHGLPAIHYDRGCAGSRAYLAFCEEVLTRNGAAAAA